jgi:hypothetical protein
MVDPMRVTVPRLSDHDRGYAVLERDDGVVYRLWEGRRPAMARAAAEGGAPYTWPLPPLARDRAPAPVIRVSPLAAQLRPV